MVLQRAPAQPTIWGHNAAVGETVSVQLDQGGLWSATADSAGHWLVRMAPQEASTGHTLTLNFSSTPRQRVLQNIAFGDVCVRLRSQLPAQLQRPQVPPHSVLLRTHMDHCMLRAPVCHVCRYLCSGQSTWSFHSTMVLSIETSPIKLKPDACQNTYFS